MALDEQVLQAKLLSQVHTELGSVQRAACSMQHVAGPTLQFEPTATISQRCSNPFFDIYTGVRDIWAIGPANCFQVAFQKGRQAEGRGWESSPSGEA